MNIQNKLAHSRGRPLDLIGIGEAMIELRADGPLGKASVLQVAYGGDVLNSLVGASRLGLRTGFVSRVGADPFGADLLDAWAAEGLDLTCCPLVPGVNGVYFISLLPNSERDFTYRRSGSAASYLSAGSLSLDYLAATRVLLVSGITQALSKSAAEATLAAARAAQATGGVVAYDPNYRATLWEARAGNELASNGAELARESFAELLPFVDVLMISDPGDFVLLSEASPVKALDKLHEHCEYVAVKRGSYGCSVFDGASLTPIPTATAKRVLDTTGAGDAWNAGFITSLLRGLDIVEAGGEANKIAAENIEHRGAIEPHGGMRSRS